MAFGVACPLMGLTYGTVNLIKHRENNWPGEFETRKKTRSGSLSWVPRDLVDVRRREFLGIFREGKRGRRGGAAGSRTVVTVPCKWGRGHRGLPGSNQTVGQAGTALRELQKGSTRDLWRCKQNFGASRPDRCGCGSIIYLYQQITQAPREELLPGARTSPLPSWVPFLFIRGRPPGDRHSRELSRSRVYRLQGAPLDCESVSDVLLPFSTG